MADGEVEGGRGSSFAGELIAEVLAVAIIIALGDSAAAMITLYDPSPYATAYWGVCIAWGLAVTIAIYVTGAVSGTHANPAVTLTLALFRDFSWRKVLPYCAAQVLGGIIGAALVHQMFGPVIDAFVNNDAQQALKKGRAIQGEENRLRIVRALRCVDRAYLAVDDGPSIARSLDVVRADYPDADLEFCNGGDRGDVSALPPDEADSAERNRITLVYGVGGTAKADSSTRLLAETEAPQVAATDARDA